MVTLEGVDENDWVQSAELSSNEGNDVLVQAADLHWLSELDLLAQRAADLSVVEDAGADVSETDCCPPAHCAPGDSLSISGQQDLLNLNSGLAGDSVGKREPREDEDEGEALDEGEGCGLGWEDEGGVRIFSDTLWNSPWVWRTGTGWRTDIEVCACGACVWRPRCSERWLDVFDKPLSMCVCKKLHVSH